MSDVEQSDAKPEDLQIPLPAASFSFLVLQFGEDDKDKVEPDLPLARHTIDLMGVLLEKTKGNLTLEENRMLENSLTELRFRYVQASEKAGKAAGPNS